MLKTALEKRYCEICDR